jgi:hypothetical protein
MPTLLRILGKAGLDLRMELTERDDHDAVLARWEQSLTDAERQRPRTHGYRLTSDVA